MLYCVTNLFVQRATNMLDTDTVAAWAAFWKLDGVYWPISNALGISVMTFVGQNYGAHRRERIFQSIHAGLALHLLISAVFGALIFVFRRPIIALFCEDEAVIACGLQIAEYLAFCYPLFSLTEVFSSAMRGAGNSVKPTVITLLGCAFCAWRCCFSSPSPPEQPHHRHLLPRYLDGLVADVPDLLQIRQLAARVEGKSVKITPLV